MFELSEEELQNWRSKFGTSNFEINMGLRYKPFAFTEQGVAQLSSVLNSDRAIQVNIHIIRLITKMRRFMMDNEIIHRKIGIIEDKLKVNDATIKKVLEYLQSLNSIEEGREKVGYKLPNKD